MPIWCDDESPSTMHTDLVRSALAWAGGIPAAHESTRTQRCPEWGMIFPSKRHSDPVCGPRPERDGPRPQGASAGTPGRAATPLHVEPFDFIWATGGLLQDAVGHACSADG